MHGQIWLATADEEHLHPPTTGKGWAVGGCNMERSVASVTETSNTKGGLRDGTNN